MGSSSGPGFLTRVAGATSYAVSAIAVLAAVLVLVALPVFALPGLVGALGLDLVIDGTIAGAVADVRARTAMPLWLLFGTSVAAASLALFAKLAGDACYRAGPQRTAGTQVSDRSAGSSDPTADDTAAGSGDATRQRATIDEAVEPRDSAGQERATDRERTETET